MIVKVTPTIKLTNSEKVALRDIRDGIGFYCENTDCNTCVFNYNYCTPVNSLETFFEDFLDFMEKLEQKEED